MNVSGVMAIIALAKKMTQLKVSCSSVPCQTPPHLAQALVDVSTAYCNCDLDHIEEKIYPSPGDPARMVDLGQVTLAYRDDQPSSVDGPGHPGQRRGDQEADRQPAKHVHLHQGGVLPVAGVETWDLMH